MARAHKNRHRPRPHGSAIGSPARATVLEAAPPAAGFGGNPGDGRPGLSPAQPATVCALQYALNLSDRQASEAVRCRADFKYALGLELEDLGCHHSVLSDFRDRLAEGARADRLPGLALTRIRRAGLLEERAARGSRHLHRL